MDLKILEYIEKRTKELDRLISQQPVYSHHRYALLAGKYELLLMAETLKL